MVLTIFRQYDNIQRVRYDNFDNFDNFDNTQTRSEYIHQTLLTIVRHYGIDNTGTYGTRVPSLYHYGAHNIQTIRQYSDSTSGTGVTILTILTILRQGVNSEYY